MTRYLLFLALLGALTVDAAAHVNSTTRAGCVSPFTMVRDRCIHVDYNNADTWDFFTNTYCRAVGGHNLVMVDDANFLADLVMYLKTIKGDHFLYWIGATDKGHEGHWVWPNGAPVKMGTPFWGTYGYYNQQYPDGGTRENCAILDGHANLYFNDFKCDDTANNVYGICEKQI